MKRDIDSQTIEACVAVLEVMCLEQIRDNHAEAAQALRDAAQKLRDLERTPDTAAPEGWQRMDEHEYAITRFCKLLTDKHTQVEVAVKHLSDLDRQVKQLADKMLTSGALDAVKSSAKSAHELIETLREQIVALTQRMASGRDQSGWHECIVGHSAQIKRLQKKLNQLVRAQPAATSKPAKTAKRRTKR